MPKATARHKRARRPETPAEKAARLWLAALTGPRATTVRGMMPK
jgi:hypothetical protein